MDPGLYPRMAAVEDTHWWFAARRAICESLLDRAGLPADAAIFEPGCGTGGNFPMLARRGRIFAMDSDPAALHFAASRGLAQLACGALPDRVPFTPQKFDLAVLTDVIEHLDHPLAALRSIHERMKIGGVALLTVPALPTLWSIHDVTHHHRRRYQAAELRSLIADAGFKIEYLSHYNLILLPAIVIARTVAKLAQPGRGSMNGSHDLSMPPRVINRLLFNLFSSERFVVGRMRLPLGLSMIALIRA
jgi:SAM-dependent methyltransferase